MTAIANAAKSISVIHWGGNKEDGIQEWIRTGKDRPYFMVRDKRGDIAKIVRKEHHIGGSVSSGSEPNFWGEDEDEEEEEAYSDDGEASEEDDEENDE